MGNIKISQLEERSKPSASATLAGVDQGKTVQIPLKAIKQHYTYDVGTSSQTLSHLFSSLVEAGYNNGEGLILTVTFNDAFEVKPNGSFIGYIQNGVTSGGYSFKLDKIGGSVYYSGQNNGTVPLIELFAEDTYKHDLYEDIDAAIDNKVIPYMTVSWDTPATKLSELINVLEANGKIDTHERVLVRLQGYNHAVLLVSAFKYNNGIYSINATNLSTCKVLRGLELDPTIVTITDFINNYVVAEEKVPDENKLSYYSFNVTETSTIYELITAVATAGYVEKDTMVLRLTGAIENSYIGSFHTWAGGAVWAFDFSEIGNSVKYLSSGLSTKSVTVTNVFGTDTYKEKLSYNDLVDTEGLATESYVNTKVAGIVNSAPEALNTLNELANALSNDANFATTVSTEIGKKLDKTAFQTFCGDLINGMDGEGNDLKVGLAAEADRLSLMNAVGSTTQPVYFKEGVPVATTYTLGKSVPSDAKFTDTVYNHPASHPASMITGLATVATSGNYNDLNNKPTIPSIAGLASTSYVDTTVSTEIGKKVDKVNGKGLSTNDYTTTEKNKLAGIAEGANKYVHPTYTAKSNGLYKVTVDSTGHVSTATAVAKADITGLGIPAQDTTYTTATTSTDGLMSSADKIRLDYLYGKHSEGLAYTLSNVGTYYTVSGIGTCTDTNVVIPPIYEGLPVTTIGKQAFYSCDSLESVVIPDSVTSIGNHAFANCDSLVSVVIPDSVTSIGDYAFFSCSSLTSVVIGDSVTSIGSEAFWGCTSLTICCEASSQPSGWNSNWNSSNRPVVWGAALDFVGVNDKIVDHETRLTEAESSLEGLATVATSGSYNDLTNKPTIPAAVTVDSALSSASINPVQNKVINTALGNKVDRVEGKGLSTNDYTTEDKIKLDYLYGDYSEGLSYGSSDDGYFLLTLGTCADTDVKIPPIHNGKPVTTISGSAFKNRSNLKSIVIPNTVTSIGGSAFEGCSSLESVVIGDSVKSIGDWAFYSCDSLTSVTIGDSVTSIGNCAFRNCDSLVSVTIPDSVTSIGSNAFYDCDSLVSVVIPDSVTSIGSGAFHWCDSLSIYCEAESQPTGWNTNWNASNCPVVWNCALDLASVNKAAAKMTPVTYSELKSLRDNSQLIPGMFYRITDYQCTTTQEGTSAMNHQFDIIVQALNERTLSETASADNHEGNPYFADTNFGAWELKYCLDNDANRFVWASSPTYILMSNDTFSELDSRNIFSNNVFLRCSDMDLACSLEGYIYAWTIPQYQTSGEADKCIYIDTEDVSNATSFAYCIDGNWRAYSPVNTYFQVISQGGGTGVIYYMKDEFGNECPYDFKNITYKGDNITSYDRVGLAVANYYPTFTNTALITYYQWGTTYGVSRNSSLDCSQLGVSYYGYTCSSTPSAWSSPNFYTTDAEISSSSTMYNIVDGAVSEISYGGNLTVNKSLDNSIGGNVHGCKIARAFDGLANMLNFNVFIGTQLTNILEENCTYNTFDDNSTNNVFCIGTSHCLLVGQCSHNKIHMNRYGITLEYSYGYDSNITPLEERLAALEGN